MCSLLLFEQEESLASEFGRNHIDREDLVFSAAKEIAFVSIENSQQLLAMTKGMFFSDSIETESLHVGIDLRLLRPHADNERLRGYHPNQATIDQDTHDPPIIGKQFIGSAQALQILQRRCRSHGDVAIDDLWIATESAWSRDFPDQLSFEVDSDLVFHSAIAKADQPFVGVEEATGFSSPLDEGRSF